MNELYLERESGRKRRLSSRKRFAFQTNCDLTEVKVSGFRSEGAASEYHLTIRPVHYGSAQEQLESIQKAYAKLLDTLSIGLDTAVFRRFACSDLPNQAEALEANCISNPDTESSACAVSWICQPPRPPSKFALWAYHIVDPNGPLALSKKGPFVSLQRGRLEHHWITGLTATDCESPYSQCEGIFGKYLACLKETGQVLADEVIRTWFFAKDVDAHYQGIVDARNAVFARYGLGADTHTIASTGIEGGNADVKAKVTLDAYSIKGVEGRQIQFLEAPDYLSSTHRYGVLFERGVSIAYRDRKHIFISGTASIDRNGEILYPGDLFRQWERVLENMQALLEGAGASLEHLNVMIVYVRDPSECQRLNEWMLDRFPVTPFMVLTAPVCRSGWLVEIEGAASVKDRNPELPEF